jgi:hypothetical protein
MSRATEGTRGVWIGLAEVHQRPGANVMLDRNEAVTNALALASTAADFALTVSRALDALGFDLVELEDPEPLAVRLAQFTVSEELLKLADVVRESGSPQFGKFHTWISNE